MSLLSQMKSPQQQVAASPDPGAQEEESRVFQETSQVLIVNLEIASLEKKLVAQNQTPVVLKSPPAIKQKDPIIKKQVQSQKPIDKFALSCLFSHTFLRIQIVTSITNL